MKKLLVISLFTLSFYLSAFYCSAQTFQTGSLIVSASAGFDGYATQFSEVNYYNMSTQNKTGGAASYNANLGAEFGVVKWLGLGLQLKLDNYIVGDSGNLKSAYGVEYGLIVNFHLVRHLHFDLLAGLDLGRSNLTLNYNLYNDQVYGSGSWEDIHLTTRVYIGRFGFSGTLYFPFIDYSSLTSNVTDFNEYVYATFKARGAGLNVGLEYHFLR